MKNLIQKSLVVLAFGLTILPSEAQTIRRERIRRDRREDVRDRREDVRDRREDVRDRREDVRDAQHQGGPLDRIEDRRDRREDVRDRNEDKRDRREDRRDRRRRGTYTTQQHPQPNMRVGIQIGYSNRPCWSQNSPTIRRHPRHYPHHYPHHHCGHRSRFHYRR